jgi:ABC-type hemin transport system substrate-binding protein
VSLVPSLTESVALTQPGALIGATDWCTHPAGLAVARVRGTKNPDIAAILALAPDLVIANKEENRRIDVHRLRAAGLPEAAIQVAPTADRAFVQVQPDANFDDQMLWISRGILCGRMVSASRLP